MEPTKNVILDRIDRKEAEMEKYRTIARKWDKMWKGDAGFGRSTEEAVRNGQEQVTLPTPFNVVNLAQRLMATLPQVNVPPTDILDKESILNAQQKEAWLTAMWPRIHQQQKRNVIGRLTLHSLVRGRHALEMKWIRDKLPKRLQKSNFPILCRELEPMNVGYEMGPHYTQWAYHRYETTLPEALQSYPSMMDGIKSSALNAKLVNAERNEEDLGATTVMVTDFWYIDEESGKVGNCVLVDDEYVSVNKKQKPGPHETDYPDIPIIVGVGDYGPGIGDEWDGLSILHPLVGTWEYQCRLVSQMATGLLWHFWPNRLIQNEYGEDVGDIEVGPGITQEVPWGTKVDIVEISPNVPLADRVYGQIDESLQQATFPGVLYGEAPGDLQAGYGVSLLSDAAKGRIKNFLESMQMTIAHANSMALAQVEVFGGSKGVDLWGMSESEKEPYRLTLTKKDIKGMYDNEVVLTPQIPQDQIQKQTIGIRLMESGAISRQTNRDSFVGVPLPEDEASRVILEEALMSDELRAWRMRTAIQQFFNGKDKEGVKEWQRILANTPLMPPPPEGYQWMPDGSMKSIEELQAEQAAQAPPPGPPQGMPPGGPPPGMQGPPQGMHQMPDGTMMPDSEMGGPPPQGMPPEMMGGPPPQGMPPPGMEQGMPPEMMGGPMGMPSGGPPPEMMGGPPPGMEGPPPGMMPEGPPLGMPPGGMGGPPPGPPPQLPSPQEIAQMSPEQLLAFLQSLPPELLEQLLASLPPEIADMLRSLLAGGPPPGLGAPPPGPTGGGPGPGGPIAPPMGGGIPPELQGQPVPEDMDLIRQQNPALFAQIMGNPLPPGEELDQLAGIPPVPGL